MGRFYKTAKPDFVENIIFQPPWELAKEVILGKDKAVDKNIEAQDALELLTQDVEAIQDDEGASNAYITSIREKADALATSMQGDMLNAAKYNPQIRALTKGLQRDLDSGLTGKTKEQFAAKDVEFKRLDALAAKDPSLTAKVDGIKKKLSTEYTEKGGLSYKGQNEYNKFIQNEVNPSAKFDESGFLTGLTSHFNKNQTAYASSGPDNKGYIWTKAGTTESVDGERVRTYMRNTPEMEKWRADVGQTIELEGFNELGLRGTELQAYKEKVLKESEEKFIEAAATRVGYKIDRKDAQVTVDQKVINDINNADRKNTPEVVKVDVVADRRTFAEIAADDAMLKKISQTAIAQNSQTLDGTNQVTLLKQLTNAKNAGKLAQFIKDNKIPYTPAEVLNLITHTNALGVRTNLVDVQDKNYTAAEKIAYNAETKAVSEALLNFDKAKTFEIVTTDNFGKKSTTTTKETVLEMFNQGLINAENLGGKVSTKTTQVPNPAMVAKGEEGSVYVDVNKRPITFKDGRVPTTKGEAISAAKETNVKVNTEAQVSYVNVLGNDMAITGTTVNRFKSTNGQVDDYEVEISIVKPGPNGTQVQEKAIVKIPSAQIKVQSTNK